MSTSANFAAIPRRSSILINTSNTNTDGTSGTAAIVFAAGSAGSRVDSVKIKGIVAEGATQSADTVRLWLYDGATRVCLQEQLVPAGGGVISAANPNFEALIPLGIQLPAGHSLLASPHTGGALGSYHVTAFGGDY